MALNEAKEKVHQLENAIKKLDLVKRHLSRNASDIKGEIHSCVSHNLECLRGREVSLLSKVDEVVNLKEEALQQQQAQLNQALGVLQTRMALITADTVLDKQMAETLTRFNEIDLSPGETPHIAFRADHMSLRESILNYGRVDANALPLPSAFDDPGKPSASLPRHVEEYEDVDHHIFHKTVEELKTDSSGTKSIIVSIPKLSTKMEDWLQKRLTSQMESCPAPVRPSVLTDYDSRGSTMPSQSSFSSSGDASSLNNWLSQIKNHSDLEEEHDFEIVDNSRDKKDTHGGSTDNYKDLKPWLNNSPGYMESLLTTPKQSQKFFQHISSDSKVWLRQACQQMTSLDEIKQKGFFNHISKEPSTWLRCRAQGKPAFLNVNGDSEEKQKEKSTTLKDKNMSKWLAQSSKQSPEKQENLENGNNNCCRDLWLHSPSPSKQGSRASLVPFQLEDICKANEICLSLSDCVCKPNCASLRQEEVCGIKNPLDPTKVFNPLQLPLSEWLISDDLDSREKMDVSHDEMADIEKKLPVDSVVENMFCQIADLSSDLWLIKPPGPTDSCVTNPAVKHIKEEANLWLQHVQDSSPTPVPESNLRIFSNMNLSTKCLSEWLSSAPNDEVSKEEDEIMKEDSEGWSLCSSPSSFNSDQFSKDVKVATSYLQKWVL